MKKNRTKKPAPSKNKLSAGEKFWQEYLTTPYSDNKVGQAFVHTLKREAPMKKISEFPAEKSKKEGQQLPDTSTQDPGLKFLEELDQMPYTYDRVGQVSVSSWKGRSFGSRTTEEHPEDLDSSND